MDNASIHKAKIIREVIEESKMNYILFHITQKQMRLKIFQSVKILHKNKVLKHIKKFIKLLVI